MILLMYNASKERCEKKIIYESLNINPKIFIVMLAKEVM